MESILSFQDSKDSLKLEILNQVIWRITDPNIAAIRVPDHPTPSTPGREVLYAPLYSGILKLYLPYAGELLPFTYSENMNLIDIIGAIYTFYSEPAKLSDVVNDPVLSKNIRNGIRVLRSDVVSPDIYFQGLTPHNDGYLVELGVPN